ncbi:MAG TPA: gamma-glutamyltransferase [Thermoanaerobaculia bacterium]|nr:gamma-glutamyltransferase [Thermoanaerobaculia bacterium]
MRRLSLLLAILVAAPALGQTSLIVERAALSTVSPEATKVGLSVLASGGNAIDAAVAVSFALAVTHPSAGNIGGGGFLVYYDAATREVWTLDYREIAPAAATRAMFLDPEGKPKDDASTVGPLASAVPGSVAGLGEAHARFGSMAWRDLLAPAVALATEGFAWRPVDVAHLEEAQKNRRIDRFATTAALLFPSGKPLALGDVVRQPELARTLSRIASEGPREFYEGTTARQLVEAMRRDGGIISARDLREYRPAWRAPIRLDYGDYRIYTMAPPSAGGILIGEMLQILKPYALREFGFQTPAYLHLLAEAARRAHLDRLQFVGDPSSTRIPYATIFSDERAAQWRASIALDRATPTRSLSDQMREIEQRETTHFSIVDSSGNIAAVTTTINSFFGNGYLVPNAGFFLNNEMDDFTTAPGVPNAFGLVQGEANAIQPGKKMASSMTPAIVFKGDSPFLVLGSPGGGTIPTTVLQVFLNVTTFGMSLADAIEAPRYHHQAWPDEIRWERGRAPVEVLDALNRAGHPTKEVDPIGDVHAILFSGGKIHVVADSRRGGLAGGF